MLCDPFCIYCLLHFKIRHYKWIHLCCNDSNNNEKRGKVVSHGSLAVLRNTIEKITCVKIVWEVMPESRREESEWNRESGKTNTKVHYWCHCYRQQMLLGSIPNAFQDCLIEGFVHQLSCQLIKKWSFQSVYIVTLICPCFLFLRLTEIVGGA